MSPLGASRARPSGSPAISPRLLSLREAGMYLGVSYWSIRDYVLAGLIPVVELPALRPREGGRAKRSLRRVLVDRDDLDDFVESRKHVGERDIQSRATEIPPVNTGANRAGVPTLCPVPRNAKCAR